MSNPWLRLYTEAVDDEKLRLLAFEDRWHFIAILCCKGKGIIDETNKDLMRRKVAVKLGLDPRTLEEVVRRLAEVGLIDAQTLQPLAWENRQFGSDSDPTRAERLRKFRENKKRMRNGHETDAKRPPEEEADTEVEAETEVSQKREEAAQAPLASPPMPTPTLSPATPTTATTPPPKAAQAPKPVKVIKSTIPAHWIPTEATYALLEKSGIERSFAEGCLDEFRLYWTERQEQRPGWEATFLNNVKRQWAHRTPPATPTPRNGQRYAPPPRAMTPEVAEFDAILRNLNVQNLQPVIEGECSHASH